MSLKEVHLSLEKMHLKTKQGEPFLLMNNKENNIIIFSCTYFIPKINLDIIHGRDI